MLCCVNTAHDARPEAGPVRLRRRSGFLEQTPQAPKSLDFLPAGAARGQMGCRRAGRALLEGSIEVGPQSASSEKVAQHVGWTVGPPVAILMTTP